MSVDIAKMRRIKSNEPPRVLIYGPPGMGKTSLAAEWPDPVFYPSGRRHSWRSGANLDPAISRITKILWVASGPSITMSTTVKP